MTGISTHSRFKPKLGMGFLCLLCISVCGFSTPSWSTPFSNKYDEQIQSAVHQYWADLPRWKLWKAQLYQESRLDPNICSGVGACGLAQFMPASWADITRQLQWNGASPFDARLAIEAGAFYQSKLRGKWRAQGRSAFDRNDLGLCAYNRGLGNCIHDQSECAGAILWKDISPCTVKHTMETVTYVQRINAYFKMMEQTP